MYKNNPRKLIKASNKCWGKDWAKIRIHFKTSSCKYFTLKGKLKWNKAGCNPHIIIWLDILSLSLIE